METAHILIYYRHDPSTCTYKKYYTIKNEVTYDVYKMYKI